MATRETIEAVLAGAVERARACGEGEPATYIPELANAPLDALSAAITLRDGSIVRAGDDEHRFTFQSSAKLVLLAGLLEERGEDEVFRIVGREPSGGGFASLARLETHGPIPANPLINPGAIALASILEGHLEDRLAWIERWAERLYGDALPIQQRVLASERRTGDRNRSIAHFLKASGVIDGDVDEVLEVYFALCSIEGSVVEASRLAAILATGGLAPRSGERVLSQRTASTVVSIMATCGMYDESGAYLCATGLPAKSGVSGVIVAVATGRGGIAVASPRLNKKGGSVRGHLVLREISRELGWHFALPD
ncbi:glutaminase A [Sandaracinus amylolyticus]|uniref:Glutaminase n=1 Tax=Sandaracinus amylolyticus TaxID=927083 RepID=A0A0F6W393_9BACT|nr:glutaminase A [Sandaracinus amylolyticus]AKF06158.1 Glutaminase [Sandaracinus amylolyticus]